MMSDGHGAPTSRARTSTTRSPPVVEARTRATTQSGPWQARPCPPLSEGRGGVTRNGPVSGSRTRMRPLSE